MAGGYDLRGWRGSYPQGPGKTIGSLTQMGRCDWASVPKDGHPKSRNRAAGRTRRLGLHRWDIFEDDMYEAPRMRACSTKGCWSS